MQNYDFSRARRDLLAGMIALGASVPLGGLAQAQTSGSGGGVLGGLLGGATGDGGLLGLLGRASDSSLDKLAKPGAFYNDAAIRIALPLVGGGGALGSLLGNAARLPIADGLVRKLNDAAGLAAKEAKPIFRTAISELSIADVPGIVRQSDGATLYLQQSAGDELKGKLRPLVDTALGQVGAFRQLDTLTRRSPLLAQAGISQLGLGDSVTTQALNGIFKYIGNEERRVRANPLDTLGGLLGGARQQN